MSRRFLLWNELCHPENEKALEYCLKKVFSERAGYYRIIKITVDMIYITKKQKKMKIGGCKTG
jgi:hypothetical protein